MERGEVEQPDRSPIGVGDRRSVLRILVGGLFGLLIELVAGWRVAAVGAEGSDSVLQAIPRRPRPATLSPLLFDGKAAQAYRIAKEAPELLEQMPCYCGCFKLVSHQNNLDCYVDRHAVG